MRKSGASHEVLAVLLALEEVRPQLAALPQWTTDLRPRLEQYLEELSRTPDPEAQARICLAIDDLVADALGTAWWEARDRYASQRRGLADEGARLASLAAYFGLPGIIFIPPPEEPQPAAYCCPRCSYRAAHPGRCPDHNVALEPCEDEA